MMELQVATGLQSYTINGTTEILFNATDSDFVERLFHVFYKVDGKQRHYQERVAKMSDNREVFAFMREVDAEIRQEIDGLFDAPVCAPVFGRMNVFALADGLPVWANLLLAILDQVDTTFAREQKATNPRIQKYTAKWNKK